MVLRVYNTLTHAKETFAPRRGRRVNMFVCGITPYDATHVGHARTYVAFDVVARYLRHRGYRVFYLQNVTDIDDRILNRVAESGEAWDALGERHFQDYLETMERLGVTSVNLYARATDYLPEILEQVEALLAQRHAYRVDGDVFYEVATFDGYGKLSRVKLEELRAGARVAVDERKRDPQDFALWKAQKPGEPAWDSPWGPGRPGWHIEDTAISIAHFGPRYDIHGGGNDLLFPHHEAEIAQAEAFTGEAPFVKYWMHTGFVVIKGERMGKSLGNVVPVRDVLAEYDAEVLRFFLLYTQYRGPIDFTPEALQEARSAYDRLTEGLTRAQAEIRDAPEAERLGDEALQAALQDASVAFYAAMDDDFNTREALGALFRLTSAFHTAADRGVSRPLLEEYLRALATHGGILGLLRPRGGAGEELLEGLVGLLLRLREEARERKDYETSDRIRSELQKLGLEIQDTPQGARWRVG